MKASDIGLQRWLPRHCAILDMKYAMTLDRAAKSLQDVFQKDTEQSDSPSPQPVSRTTSSTKHYPFLNMKQALG